MDDKLIFRLKEFYELERFQVAFYQAQANSAQDEYYKKAFEKMTQIEQNHADFFEDLIKHSGELVPSVAGSFLQITGSIVGEAVEATGQYNTLKLGIKLENKAMEHYRTFIKECEQKSYYILRNSLMDYLLDEEFHTLWLRDYMDNHSN